MKGKSLFMSLSYIDRKFINEAEFGTIQAKHLSLKKALLIAAIVSLALLLVGCGIAYINGWFTDFFGIHSSTPLSDSQMEYIEKNEQIIQEIQENGGWSVELKSAISDGETGYILFGVTAPADVNLEEANDNEPNHYDCIIPGNAASMTTEGRNMFNTSMGIFSEENNIIWQYGSGWEIDQDGLSNTMDYFVKIRCEKYDPNQPRLLENPFTDTQFYIVFDNFVHAWEDQEIRKEIDEKYAGQDYMIDGDEMNGLYKSEVQIEGEWEFAVTFDIEAPESIELISEPIMVEAKVHRKIENGTMFYDTKDALEQIKLTSFVLKPLGAELMFEQEEDVIGAFFQWDHTYGYDDRYIYVVMADGNRIMLKTDSVGTNLTAETPIVISEVDHVLMGDGSKLEMPN